MILFSETLAAFLGLLAFVFFSFHFWLMLKGMTTIEFLEKSTKKAGRRTSPYDLGICRNVEAVLGENPLLWLLPCSPPTGTGLFFPSRDTSETAGLVRDMESGQDLERRRYQKRGQVGTESPFPPPYGSIQ